MGRKISFCETSRTLSFSSLDPVEAMSKIGLECVNFTNNKQAVDFTSTQVKLVQLKMKTGRLEGLVAVCNVQNQASISIRYSFNYWKSFSDSRCFFVCSSERWQEQGSFPLKSDVDFDLYKFSLTIPSMPLNEFKLIFAIKYSCNNYECWDNNWNSDYMINFVKLEKEEETKPEDSYKSISAPMRARLKEIVPSFSTLSSASFCMQETALCTVKLDATWDKHIHVPFRRYGMLTSCS